ncbi:MAG: outer membrane beta-barrel protein [Prevotella fusca]|uniref:outer membrane beta-barrel family protein n=1 Tax=Prevotella fusca TaxID=589436 RepID=UPI003FA0AB3B
MLSNSRSLARGLLVAVLKFLFSLSLSAQTPYVGGTVKDATGVPVEFATVTLLSGKDSTVITGMVTKGDGSFSLDVTNANQPTVLRISFIGYKDCMVSNPAGDIGGIVLEPVDLQLNEVVVKANRRMVKLRNDGVQVDIAGTYLSHIGSALELLGKMPFVSKSGADIEVLGKGAPLIYINNRQVRDQSELTRLSSSEIKHIEVVTSPGARYASTVNAVIRITTVVPTGDGFSFNDRTTIGFKHYAYLFEQTNFNYRRKGFDLAVMLNYENYRERPHTEHSTTQYLPTATIEQRGTGWDFAKYPTYSGKIGLNYNHKAYYLGLFYDFRIKPSEVSGPSEVSRYVDGVFSEQLENSFTSSRHGRQHLLSAYYTGALGKWQLSVNLDALWQLNDRHTDEHEQSSVNLERNFATVRDIYNRLLAGNVSVSYPVWKGEMRIGTESSNIHRTDRYTGDAVYIASSDNRIEETTTALFAESSQTFGSLSANIGLRWEYTDSKYYHAGTYSPGQSRTYHNLAPTASLSFPVGKVKTRLAYTRKTSRPAFDQLGSALKYIDRYTYESGNPNLRPIYRDYLSLSTTWKDLSVEVSYISTKNYFMWQTQPYPGNAEATLLQMQNMPRFHSGSAFANYSPTFFGCWHPVWMAGVMLQDFKQNHHGEQLRLDHPLGIFRFNNAVQLPWDMWLNIDFSARTSGNGENAHIRSYWTNDLGLYKSFAKDTWNIKLQVNDVFGTWRQQFIMFDALTRMDVNKIRDTRDFSVTLRYNFNAARSRYKGHGAGNAEKDRF